MKGNEHLVDNYLKHGTNIFRCMELESLDGCEESHRTTRYKTSTFAPTGSKEEIQFLNDLKMECCDMVPPIDRPNFPITNIVELIPRLLFDKNALRVETTRTVNEDFSFTSVYLSH